MISAYADDRRSSGTTILCRQFAKNLFSASYPSSSKEINSFDPAPDQEYPSLLSFNILKVKCFINHDENYTDSPR